MKIVFDMDGVLVDFYRGFWAIANEKFGTPEKGDPANWTWDNYGVGLAEKQADRVWEKINTDPEFWLSLSPLATQDELRRVALLADRHEVYFVTSRTGTNPKQQTEQWLHSTADIDWPTVILSKRKGEVCAGVKADYSIEDKAGNAVYIAYQSPKTRSYILDAPYNKFSPDVLGSKVKRVSSVTEFLDDIEAGPKYAWKTYP